MNELETHRLLSDAFRAVAAEDALMGASPDVEARLLREVDAMARGRRHAMSKMYAAAALLIAAVAASVWSVSTGGRSVAGRQAIDADQMAEQTTDFFPLHYSSVPAVDAHIVRLEVSRAALASFGLEAGNDASRTVLADVIVGSDGLARAIRFVGVGTPEEQRQ